MTDPFFSILLPTRDRPLFVQFALFALTQQTYKNFEVILSDNYINKSCQKVYENFKDKLNIRYVCPRPPLSMAENYTYALSLMSGDYVIALEDKTILFPNALLDLVRIIKKKEYEVINFLFDGYYVNDDSFVKGRWMPYYNIYPPQEYDPQLWLKKRIKFSIACGLESPFLKYRNRVLVGCWSTKLVDRIKKKHTIFQPLSPDYTSGALGALYTRTASYDMGRPIGLAIQAANYSNGALTTSFASAAHKFLQESDPLQEYKLYSPFKESTFVQAISLASDFIKIIRQVGVSNLFKVNVDNLSIRAHEEIEQMKDLSDEEKSYQKSLIKLPALWKRAFSKLCTYCYARYHTFLIVLYLKVNILGRLNIKKYKTLLQHRKFLQQNKIPDMPIEEALAMAGEYYKILFDQQQTSEKK